MKPKYEWTQTKEYEHRLAVGPFVVAEVFHHAPKLLDRDKPWIVQCLLPGVEIRKDLRFSNATDAMVTAEKSVEMWFNGALRDV